MSPSSSSCPLWMTYSSWCSTWRSGCGETRARGAKKLRRIFRDGRITLVPQPGGFYIARSEVSVRCRVSFHRARCGLMLARTPMERTRRRTDTARAQRSHAHSAALHASPEARGRPLSPTRRVTAPGVGHCCRPSRSRTRRRARARGLAHWSVAETKGRRRCRQRVRAR